MIRIKRTLIAAAFVGIAIAPLWTAGVLAQSDRARHVAMNLKCLCKGCDMSAGGCSHPGGTFTGPCNVAKDMMKEVDQHIAKGETDEQIMQAFVNEYGSIVYVVPPKTGFGLVAWLMPIVYVVLGLGLVVFVIRKWYRPAAVAGGNANAPRVSAEVLDRVRAQVNRETED